MPAYYARGVSAHLGEMPLADTITPDIVVRKGKAAKQQCETAEQRLQESQLLTEQRVIFPGDEAGFELNWLGNAPFMQVQASRHFFRPNDKQDLLGRAESAMAETAYGRSRSQLFTDENHDDDKPRALVLHIHLSGKAFVSGLTNNKTHLKVDVFFNGQLSSCLFLPVHDVRSGVNPIHRVFAGTRIDFLAERPWVILPPDVSVDGSVRQVDKPSSAQARWQQICQILQEEAEERTKDLDGSIPPSAEFLNALANMQMPAQVNGMQKPGGRQFGVIDVVISAGDGRKITSGTSYLKAPQRLAAGNSPLIVEGDSLTTRSYASRVGRDNTELEDRESVEPSPDLIDVDAEGDTDSDYGPHPKRQALTSHVLSTQSAPETSFSLASSNPFMGIQIPSMLPSSHNTPKCSPSPTARYDCSRTPLVMPQNRSHTRSSSHERRRVHDEDQNTNIRGRERRDGGTAPDSTPQVFHSALNSNTAFAQTSQLHPSPYDFQIPVPILGQDSSSDPMSLRSFDSAGPMSSPLQHFPLDFDGSLQHSLLPLSARTGTDRTLLSSSPYSASLSLREQVRRGSFDPQMTPVFPYATLATQERIGTGSQYPGVPRVLGPIRSMSPPAPPYFGPYSTVPPASYLFPPPYNCRPSAPLPPKGLYTVPTKPKASTSPPNDPGRIKENNAPPSILISRLVITGKRGATLVDHRWCTAQRVAVNSFASSLEPPPGRSPVRSTEETPRTTEYVELHTGVRQSTKRSVEMQSPPLISPMASANSNPALTFRNQGRDTTHTVQVIQKPHETTVADCAFTSEVGKQRLPRNQNTAAGSIEVSTQDLTSFLGVQGRKASTFWLEDPEELLREAARSRRSRSTTKRNTESAVELQSKHPAPVISGMIASETISSSPLSSVPTTPELEVGQVLNRVPPEAATLLYSNTRVAQAASSPGLKIRPAPPRSSQTQSPPKLPSTVPRLQAQASTTPKSSPSLKLRKRKAPSRYLPKQPRSPDRLKTVDNPPLNRDCVIAYAETEDKDCDRGMLRQVRGERQGVFQEYYVVFATRFFIAGD